jgi:uncharacterized membrane protein
MKTLIKNNYIQIDAFKAVVVGIARDENKDWIVLLGPIAITFYSYMFKKPRRTKVGGGVEVF